MLFCPDKGIFRYTSELTHGCQFKKQIGQEGIAFPDIGQDNIALQNLLTSVQISAAQKGCCAKGQNPSVLAKEFRHRLIQPEKLIVHFLKMSLALRHQIPGFLDLHRLRRVFRLYARLFTEKIRLCEKIPVGICLRERSERGDRSNAHAG